MNKFAAFVADNEKTRILTTPSFARASSTRNLAPPAEMKPVSAGWPPPCGWKTVASSTTATRPPSSCGHPELSSGRVQPRVSRLRRRRRGGKGKPGGRRGRWRSSGALPYHRSRQAWWGPQASPVQPPAPCFRGGGGGRPEVIAAGDN